MIKITSQNGRYRIFAERREAGRSLPAISSGYDSEDGKILRISSTEPQPYVVARYDDTGRFVGGRTLTETLRDQMIAQAKKAGWEVT